jgi:hypothetical protein
MDVRVVRGVPLTSVTRILEAYQRGDVGHEYAMRRLYMQTFEQLLCALDDRQMQIQEYEDQE